MSFRDKNTNLAWPSREAISNRCGYAVGTISNNLKTLSEKGWVSISKRSFNGPNTYEITVPESHRSSEVHRISEVHRTGEHEVHRSSELQCHRSSDTNRPRTDHKNIPTKVELPDWLNVDVWKAFCETRQTGKTRFTPHAKKLALSKLESLCPGGENHEAVINQTIENGWKTFYPLKSDDKLQEWLNG